MGLITHAIRSLVNGVSQQVASMRLDNQVETQLNMTPDVSIGLTRRNPIKLNDIIAHDESYTDQDEEHFMFSYIQQGETRYMAVRPNGEVYRFDKNKALSTVTSTTVQTYLTHTDPSRLMTVETEDKVFILNKDVVVLSDTSSATGVTYSRLLIWLTSITIDVTYTFNIYKDSTGSTPIASASHKAVAGNTPQSVITTLANALVAAGTHIIRSEVKGNSSYLIFDDLQDYIVVADNDAGYKQTYGVVEANQTNSSLLDVATNLPKITATLSVDSDTPFLVRIQADTDQDDSAYYLAYDDVNATWREERLYGSDILDVSTLPVTIIKDTLDDISVIENSWTEGGAGDNKSNKSPSFVGKTLTDMIIYNSRLGFASENTLVFSEVSEHDNFYRTTAAQGLIADRVDLQLDSTRLGYQPIKSLFTTNGQLFTNTGETQSLLTVTTDLDLSKASFNKVSAHALGDAAPLPFRKSTYFPVSRSGFGNLIAFGLDAEGTGYSGDIVTRHCERYIEGEILQAVYSNDVLLLRVDSDKKKLYVQNSFIDGSKLAQNAWHEWTFKYDIKYIKMINDVVDIVFEDNINGQTLYGSAPLIPQAIANNGFDSDVVLGYQPYLDFYTNDITLANLMDDTSSINATTGKIETHIDTDQLTGHIYESSVTLSEQVPRVDTDEGKTKMGFAKLMLRRMVGTLGISGRFLVTVSKTGRPDSTYKYAPAPIGVILIGRESLSRDELRFAVNGASTDVTINFSTVDSYAPFNILSIEYQAQLITRGQRI